MDVQVRSENCYVFCFPSLKSEKCFKHAARYKQKGGNKTTRFKNNYQSMKTRDSITSSNFIDKLEFLFHANVLQPIKRQLDFGQMANHAKCDDEKPRKLLTI